ncbi:hypothetical protein HOY80DRAFT_1138718 [Tuber brumale]|nr:hypothetical protein HOY80DRAFT_1138718 [Tuber brumale]
MKWTADNDQLLFLKLIETHDVSVRPQKIQEAWPRDGREVPTARAISERIAKLRNTVKTASTGPTSFSPTSSTQTTPRKRKNVQDNSERNSSGSNGHFQGRDAGKEQEEPVRKRRGRPKAPPAFVKERLEDGSFTPFPPGLGIFGAGRLGDEPSGRIKAAKRNSEVNGEGQAEETN